MNNISGIESILITHYEKYPSMQIQDMVKLIYQNEFAGGHFIASKAESLERLEQELCDIAGLMESYAESDAPAIGCGSNSDINDDIVSGQLFEDIGNGLCRLHLRGLISRQLSTETVNRFFVYTANSNKGSRAGFEEKLGVLRDCCEKGSLPFSASDLDNYLFLYRKQGCPPLSHSEKYREEYSPAYRIVKSVFCDYFEVFCRIDQLLNNLVIHNKEIFSGLARSSGQSGISRLFGLSELSDLISLSDSEGHINVAIDGNSGAGKSSLATLLQEIYDCNIFHMDHFFLTPDLKSDERLNEAGGNVDYVRFKNEVIDGIRSGNEFKYHIYDCSNGSLDKVVNVSPKKLNIIEGSYSMHPTLADSYDLKIFLSIDANEQSRRILKRNGPFLHEKFLSLWIPLENRYFSELNILSRCDLVINA